MQIQETIRAIAMVLLWQQKVVAISGDHRKDGRKHKGSEQLRYWLPTQYILVPHYNSKLPLHRETSSGLQFNFKKSCKINVETS